MANARVWIPAMVLALFVTGCSQKPYPVFAVRIGAPAEGTAPASTGTTAGAAVSTGTSSTPIAGRASGEIAGPHQMASRRARRNPGPRKPWPLNQAPAAVLAQLPGMDGPTLSHILAGRPYKEKRELLTRHILTAAQYARWKNDLVVHRDWKGSGEAANQGKTTVAVRRQNASGL